MEECVICMDCDTNLLEFKCGHKFHRHCIEEWIFNNKYSCPCCRAFIVPKNDSLLNRQLIELQLLNCSIKSKVSNKWNSYNIIGSESVYYVDEDGSSFCSETVYYEYDDGSKFFYQDNIRDYTYLKWKCKNLESETNKVNFSF